MRPLPLQERFWKNVVKMQSGCWHWVGSRINGRYGRLGMGRKKVVLAHRLSWQLLKGEIPKGINVLHHCDNPPCVNPDHLFLGTAKDNSQDMIKKGRGYLQRHPEKCLLARPQSGEQNHNAKLSVDDVRAIRLAISDGVKQRTLARIYDVSENQIKEIKLGRRWAFLSHERGD